MVLLGDDDLELSAFFVTIIASGSMVSFVGESNEIETNTSSLSPPLLLLLLRSGNDDDVVGSINNNDDEGLPFNNGTGSLLSDSACSFSDALDIKLIFQMLENDSKSRSDYENGTYLSDCFVQRSN